MGASRGIGRAIAAALAREGARRRDRQPLAGADRGGGGRDRAGAATPFVADASDLERLAALPGEVEAALGPIDILVANTGGPPFGGALDHELEEWERAYRSLVLAPRVLADAVVPGMRERGWGRIVNVGSSSTREPIPGLNLSNSHRMAAVGFLKTLSRRGRRRRDHRQHGRHRAASPPSGSPTRPARWRRPKRRRESEVPAGRLGRPEEYGDLVAFLCSERAAYITGTVIPIDGGLARAQRGLPARPLGVASRASRASRGRGSRRAGSSSR